MLGFPTAKGRRPRPRVLVAAGAAIATVAALTVAGMGPASAAIGSPVIGVGSGRCLDVVGNVDEPRTRLNIHDCNGQDNQAWQVTQAGELKVFDATMCLDVVGQDTTAPADVQIFTCHGGPNQQWRINPDGTITGVQSGLCLDVKGEATGNSAPVQLYTCTGRDNQKWRTSGGGDTQPPTVPGNARVSNLTCDSVDFAWDASTDDVGVTAYDIYHDGQKMTTVSGSTLTTSLTLVPGARWALYVNALDAAGNVSQASEEVVIDVPQCAPDTEAPTAPERLRADASGTTVTLNWDASSDNVGVRFYDVFRDDAKVGSVAASGSTPPVTTFSDSGLAASTRYRYHVVARDAQGNVSGPSNTAVATTAGACSNPVCEVKQVATDNDVPWGLVTLSDGTILYNRRDAHDIVHLNPATGAKVTVGRVPNVQSTAGEGGLLGLAISPAFDTDRWLYIMHTSPTDNRIVRIRMENDRLVGAPQVLLAGMGRNKYHNGGRLRFGPDGKLYASTGDAQNEDWAQDTNRLEGKVLRINPDGSIPGDNPFGNAVWSYGHRNPQGLAFDSQGRLWEQEFGNGIMDETNLITRGGNYGWPACEGTAGDCDDPEFIAPKRTYSTGDASCSGLTVVRDVVYIACTRGQRMFRAPIDNGDLPTATQHFTGTYGRLRTVEPAPDGGLWLTTTTKGDKDSTPNNSDERILHVTLG
jgi:glucose/arabinose dehydrogenase